ncbi:hypothetical protein AB6A40_007969 [Gnathostoma spinigerum]|uniref:Rab-GAP TBC domain-containing protein n=1 Tax=Gnathostoma spinigerum TaxID=75299 RepID=A0ABD6EMR7_9BILA
MYELNNPDDRINHYLERESELTTLQLKIARYDREMEVLKEKNRKLEQKVQELSTSIEAYKDAVRAKDDAVRNYIDKQEEKEQRIRSMTELIDEGAMTEGILVDISDSAFDMDTRRVLKETSVDDINEMRDLVEGYRDQNAFLNQEVLDLQRIVSKLKDRESRVVRQNFDIEACYYQLKSRYIMILNHFKSTGTPGQVLEPGVIKELIDEASITPSRRTTMSRDSDDLRLTDSLGFYFSPTQGKTHPPNADMLDAAMELKNKCDKILDQREMAQNAAYIEWLQKWDSFLVSHSNRPLKPCDELKSLIRTGVPKTYRHRVWKNLISYLVDDQRADLGNGYYEALLRRANRMVDEDSEDCTFKQIDLDLARTLPTNKYFDQPNSEKIESLRRVLYAYRVHNKSVGYCQGLNRLAAVALLFLDESNAFWFLVACVEHLQPQNYYTPSLVCAVADQKVLRDLVSEKLPKLSSHLKRLEVDLSALTLGWFLTCFVDILPHDIYLHIFDIFLYEGNKVLFRFALGILKSCEPALLECKTIGAAHACFSSPSHYIRNFKSLAEYAFHDLNPFPLKGIETRRQSYIAQLNGNAK